jgi:hypothetical protein
MWPIFRRSWSGHEASKLSYQHKIRVWDQSKSNLTTNCRSQWPRGLRRGSVAARLLELRVRILLVTWMSVSCECCVLSGKGLCVGLITRPENSYRIWCMEPSVIVKPRQRGGLGPLRAIPPLKKPLTVYMEEGPSWYLLSWSSVLFLMDPQSALSCSQDLIVVSSSHPSHSFLYSDCRNTENGTNQSFVLRHNGRTLFYKAPSDHSAFICEAPCDY